jgi:hypothetical protein
MAPGTLERLRETVERPVRDAPQAEDLREGVLRVVRAHVLAHAPGNTRSAVKLSSRPAARHEAAGRARRARSPADTLGLRKERRSTKARAPDGVRNEFQRDRDRIIHAKAFRRLMHKTQVFIAPDGDHFRTRLTHTLEMMQISRTIARSLDLNEDLAEAIALGHDLGHTPSVTPAKPPSPAHSSPTEEPSATTSTPCASWTNLRRMEKV